MADMKTFGLHSLRGLLISIPYQLSQSPNLKLALHILRLFLRKYPIIDFCMYPNGVPEQILFSFVKSCWNLA